MSHKRVKDIAVKNCGDAEYMRLYRERSTGDRIATAAEMGVLDNKWAQEVYEALRNPSVRRAYCTMWLALFLGFGGVLLAYAVARVVS